MDLRFMKVSIGKAAALLGVSRDTLRRWESAGKIKAERTPRGHRRYDLGKLRGVQQIPVSDRKTIGYARVSGHDQKKDLQRQVELLEAYCAARGWSCEIIQDLGSGLNYKKRGLNDLIKRICSNGIQRIVLTNKDRLLRFGAELIFSLCELFDIEVVLINSSEQLSFEEDLAQDVLEIITVFSARLYGSRSRKNKKLMEELRTVAETLP
jgi:excisionase family DNA binding protein